MGYGKKGLGKDGIGEGMSTWTEEECWEYADWSYGQRADRLAENEAGRRG